MKHLFSECVKTNELWSDIYQWIRNKIGRYIPITTEDKILGYTNHDQSFLLLHTHRYIFWSAKNNKLNFYILQKNPETQIYKYTEEKNELN